MTTLRGAIELYLDSRPKLTRTLEWLRGRRYLVAELTREPGTRPLAVVIAHQRADAARARRIALALEQDWQAVPPSCHEAYEAVLAHSPELVVLPLRMPGPPASDRARGALCRGSRSVRRRCCR
jgi:hypothetical protein